MGQYQAVCAVLLSMVIGTVSEANAQGSALLFSTSGDAQLPGRTADDGEVSRFVPGQTPHVLFNASGLETLLGEVPGDIDGLHFEGPGRPSYRNLQFSLLSNQLGFKDGDILALDSAGQIVLVRDEDSIATALGISGSNIDVDGFTYNESGELLVTIDGNVGTIQDGDVYRLPAGAPAVLVYTEDQVRLFVETALGTPVTSIGDTLGLAWDPTSRSLAFCVQSPSSDDATVFVDDQGGRAVPGHRESDFGFGNAVELNAIAFTSAPTDGYPLLDVDDSSPAEGATIQFSLEGGSPNGLFWFVASGGRTYETFGPGLGGTEVWLLDRQNALYQQLAGSWWRYIGRWDAQGSSNVTVQVPSFGGQPVAAYVQAFDMSGSALSNALTIHVN